MAIHSPSDSDDGRTSTTHSSQIGWSCSYYPSFGPSSSSASKWNCFRQANDGFWYFRGSKELFSSAISDSTRFCCHCLEGPGCNTRASGDLFGQVEKAETRTHIHRTFTCQAVQRPRDNAKTLWLRCKHWRLIFFGLSERVGGKLAPVARIQRSLFIKHSTNKQSIVDNSVFFVIFKLESMN